jgi:hypothetical protein
LPPEVSISRPQDDLGAGNWLSAMGIERPAGPEATEIRLPPLDDSNFPMPVSNESFHSGTEKALSMSMKKRIIYALKKSRLIIGRHKPARQVWKLTISCWIKLRECLKKSASILDLSRL